MEWPAVSQCPVHSQCLWMRVNAKQSLCISAEYAPFHRVLAPQFLYNLLIFGGRGPDQIAVALGIESRRREKGVVCSKQNAVTAHQRHGIRQRGAFKRDAVEIEVVPIPNVVDRRPLQRLALQQLSVVIKAVIQSTTEKRQCPTA